jgi:hypothetical protein
MGSQTGIMLLTDGYTHRFHILMLLLLMMPVLIRVALIMFARLMMTLTGAQQLLAPLAPLAPLAKEPHQHAQQLRIPFVLHVQEGQRIARQTIRAPVKPVLPVVQDKELRLHARRQPTRNVLDAQMVVHTAT